MDKNFAKCCLCLSLSETYLNIFNEGIDDKTIASILTQHFWIQMNGDDYRFVICQNCWTKVADFHSFYTRVYNIHFELGVNVDKSIKLEINDALDTEDIYLTNDNNNKKHHPSGNKISNSPTLNNVDDESQDHTSSNDLNKTSSENNSDSESLSPQIKRPAHQRNADGKRRKYKTVKTIQAKKPPNPDKIAKIEHQNKQISDYFSMSCELCTMKLNSFPNLQAHYRKEHKIKGYVRCCSRKYIKRHLILEHLQRHLEPITFKCEICKKIFIAKQCLELHMRSHMPPEERPYRCTECPKTYVISSLLKRHLQTHAIERKFVCEECKKTFVTKDQLKCHQRSMHNEATNYICDVCAKHFRSKDTFVKHQKSVHGNNPLPKVQCNLCGSWLKDNHYLKRHIRRHSDKEVSIACNICGRSAPNSNALQSHIRSVHSNKVYACNLCEKTFKRQISLKEHLASHTGAILYSCPYCSKTFNSSANMYAHRKRSHLKEWEKQKLEKNKQNSECEALDSF